MEDKTGEELDKILEKLLNSDIKVKYKNFKSEIISDFYKREQKKYNKKLDDIRKILTSLNESPEIYKDLITDLKKNELKNNEMLKILSTLNELIMDENIPELDFTDLKKTVKEITHKINSTINENKRLSEYLSNKKINNNEKIKLLSSQIELIQEKEKELEKINKDIESCENNLKAFKNKVKKNEDYLKVSTDSFKEEQNKKLKENIIPKYESNKNSLFKEKIEKEKELEIINKNINKENISIEYDSLINENREIDIKLEKCNDYLTYFNKENSELVNLKDILISRIDEYINKKSEIIRDVQEKNKEKIEKSKEKNEIFLKQLKNFQNKSDSCNNTIFIPIIDTFKNLILKKSMFDFTNKYKEPYLFPKENYIEYFYPTKEVLIVSDYLLNKICTVESFFLKKIENYIFKDFSIFFSDFNDSHNEFKDYEEEYNQDLIEQINNLSIKISIDNNEYKIYIPYNLTDYKEKIANYLQNKKTNKFNIECIQYLLIFFCNNKYRQQYFDEFDDNILNFKDKDEFIKYIENQKEKYEIK